MSSAESKRDDALDGLAASVKDMAAVLKQQGAVLASILADRERTSAVSRESVPELKIPSGGGAGAAGESKSTVPTKTSLTASQEARLAALEVAAAHSNATLLGATTSQQKILSDAVQLDKVSDPVDAAGAAGLLVGFLGELKAKAGATATKLKDLTEAKSFPELLNRLVAIIVANANDKAFVAFISNHVDIIARLNEQKVFAAAKFYHYRVFALRDKAEQEGAASLSAFYSTTGGGHASLLAQANAFNANKGKGGGGGRGARGRGNSYESGSGGSFRGGPRGGGKGGRGAGGGTSAEGSSSI